MRYAPGSLQPSNRNLFLIRQTLQCGVTSRDYLYRFSKLAQMEQSRRAFNNRLLRLERHKYVRRLPGLTGQPAELYVVTELGESYLTKNREIFSSRCVHREFAGTKINYAKIDHYLELNEIRLAFTEKSPETKWEPESLIKSRADFGIQPYAKEYDGVLFFRRSNHKRRLRLAVEYERTPKGRECYAEILQEINHDPKTDGVLYIVPNAHVYGLICSCFQEATKPVLVGHYHELRSAPLEAEVTWIRHGWKMPVSRVLDVLFNCQVTP